MNWIKIKDKLPPKRKKAYQVLVIAVKTYEEGNYKGFGIKTVVQDWVVREWKLNFTHWLKIEEPKKL